MRTSRSGIEVNQCVYSPEETLTRENSFKENLRGYFGDVSSILTADFQITRLSSDTSGLLTDVRYEFVGAGNRGTIENNELGVWRILWEYDHDRGYRIRRWLLAEETRSQSRERFYSDITRHALGGERILPGADAARSGLLAHCSRWCLRHRYLRTQWHFGG